MSNEKEHAIHPPHVFVFGTPINVVCDEFPSPAPHPTSPNRRNRATTEHLYQLFERMPALAAQPGNEWMRQTGLAAAAERHLAHRDARAALGVRTATAHHTDADTVSP